MALHFLISPLATSIVLIFGISGNLAAQSDTSLIEQTKSYVRYIDSIDYLDNVQGIGFLKAVADGTVTANGEIIGGSGKYTLSNLQRDTVFKIEYNEARELNIYKVFYFRHHQLIFARFELKTTSNFPTSLYKREEFYHGSKIIFKSRQPYPTHYIDLAGYSLFSDGQQFLSDFKKWKGMQ